MSKLLVPSLATSDRQDGSQPIVCGMISQSAIRAYNLRIPGAWSMALSLLLLNLVAVPAVLGADCNGNGVDDIEDINNGYSADCNGNNIPDECEGWPIRLSIDSDELTFERSPKYLASGDLDNDGDPDLIVGQQSGATSSLSVILNQGGRSFENAGDYVVNGILYTLSLVDLNGDAFLDVVVASGARIVTLFNQGDGSLDGATTYTPIADTRFVHAADVNGDGAADLLSADRGMSTVSLWLNANQGDGRLDDALHLELGAVDPVSIVTADVDGDGDPDLVTANRGTRDFSVLLNDGDGAFASPATYPHGGASPDPLSLNVADFNGDGAPDLAITADGALIIVFNNGVGAFGEPITRPTPLIPNAVKLLGHADLDRDGDLDLVTQFTQTQGLRVEQNDGSGGFGITTEIAVDSLAAAMTVADFDGDGWKDLALASLNLKAVNVVWNDAGKEGASPGIEELEPTGLELVILELEGCGDERGCRPHGGTLIDLDGDGDLDAVGIVTHPAEFVIIDNVDGIMTPRPKPYRFGATGQQNGEHGQWVTAGDLDGDGDMDLVSVDNHSNDLWAHINVGGGVLERVRPNRRVRVGAAPQHVALGDLDGDGDLDGVVSNLGDDSISIVTGNGDGTFEARSRTINTGLGTTATVIADLTGDAAADIVTANSAARSLTLLVNDGNGNFPSRGRTLRLAGNPNGVTAADLDNDGDLDLIAAIGDRRNCAILLNEDDGSFARPTYYPVDQAGVYSVSAVDFNRDGFLDLVTANEGSGSVTIMLGNGDGTFRAPTSYSAGRNAGPRVALPGDLDGDGDLDIVTFNREGHTASVFYNRSVSHAPDFVESICTVADFLKLSAQVSGGDEAGQRFVKFTLPSSDEATLRKTVYQNSSRFPLHQEFLANTFPESFPALDAATYDNLVGRRDSRRYFVGAVRVIRSEDDPLFGFNVFARFGDSREKLSAQEVKAIHEQLKESFHLTPLHYAPTSLEAVEVARRWQKEDPGFPILIEGSTGAFEPYTVGVGYGRVRILSAAEFETANESGEISFQDILILERAPRDIEGVVNGIISAERQGELSHVAVRTARRGTPNAFLRTALEDFAELEGKLVRLQVSAEGYSVREAPEEQALAFWEANAGFLSRLPSLDSTFQALSTLEMIAEMDRVAAGAPAMESRFGGKAVNLARLQSILTGEWGQYRMNGFAVPMVYYLRFIRSNKMPSAFDSAREVTYEDYLKELFASEEFGTNSRFRFEALADLREHMRDLGQVDENLLARLRERISEVLGTPPERRVRFRSSSNVEDAIEFNGAGLYDSTQVCVADDLDGDTTGPSICNKTKNGERGVLRGLRRVWSSLWNFRAYEERAFYRIPNELVAMGILVNEAFVDELANGVATTGNPATRHDRRFVITAQLGNNSVVSPDPGSLPEKNILVMGENGEVVNIIRAVASTLVEAGEFVLSDLELKELGALMAHVRRELPVDPGEHSLEDILFEMEFKKRADGSLALKQVRPLLLSKRGPAPPTFALEIPAETTLCATFNAPSLSRTVTDEFELKAQLHLVGGVTELPTAIDEFSGNLIEKLVLGQNRRVATPAGPGAFTLDKVSGDQEGLLIYRFDYEQQLVFPDGETVEVKLALLDFHTRDGVIVDQSLTFDEAYLIDELSLRTRFEHRGKTVTNFYGSCDLELLPLWEIRAELADGTTVLLEERYRNEAFGDFQPAALVGAVVEIAGQRRKVTDYWNLVYKATRHNAHAEHMIVFDLPVIVPGLEKPVFAIHLIAPSTEDKILPVAIYLDENLQEIATTDARTYERSESFSGNSDELVQGIQVAILLIEVDDTTDEYLTISFQRSAASDDVTYRVDSSSDLVNWRADAVRVSLIDNGDDVFTETWRGASPTSADTALFLRLSVRIFASP